MRKSIIVAASQNGVIGKDGKLPWHLPGDLKRFKELTMGHTLIMGRKTYESLPPKVRPLPGRQTVVLTHQKTPLSDEQNTDWDKADSWAGAWALAAAYEAERRAVLEDGLEPEVFVCGGGEVYREALLLVDRVYLTVVERDFEGDTYFGFYTEFIRVEWKLIIATESGEGDLPHHFEIWERVR